MQKKLSSFAPVLPTNPKVLILGSMPGGKSLEKQEYYGNPRNHFWEDPI
ncbi:uracil-DNA glycosylase family protein [Oceanobacillus kapialis]